ncbi:Smr/MutS family protein [Mucilaginibacter sp. BJC16-A38]|uniref:Smr/MutS family protein n=1 Tax=Mucilaginibacter phenanthrenivorans TaxID=1234842 RepID=UPI0021580523|nr:Smr/MutS family protein [Mucilaginibacter phenanthrenivorans]MCR8557036.1 Smr/MutS family protein [Mucilaginibacter phenanthrenivorans]
MSKYKLGDFVRFVDEKMEGFVTRIIDDQMIGVTGEDDFEIPVLASKVTTVHGYVGAGSKKDELTEEQQAPAGEFNAKGVYIGVVNDPKANSVVHFYLVNDTSFQLLASLTTEKLNTFKGEFSGIAAPNTATKIYSAQLADLQLWPKLIFHIVYHTKQNQEPPAPLVINEKFKAKDFSGAKKIVPVLKQQGWLIRLDEPELVIDAEKLKESFFQSPEEKVVVDKPGGEVDLHIEKLRNDYQFLNSGEILKVQLDTFHKALDAAIVHQQSEIVFIHGAGNGTLRHEIHKLLGKHQKIQTFMDARKEKFGYGATKVLLK